MALDLKTMIKCSFFWQIWDSYRCKRELSNWQRNGQPMPPPHLVKQREIRKLAKFHNLKILIETGTYLGDMVAAMTPHFERVYSIELSNSLYERAKVRFQGNSKVQLINGDSGAEIAKVVKILDKPALFWLDGHYSAGITARGEKDTPIFEELSHVLSGPRLRHVIMVDDARCFGMERGYPSVEAISHFVKTKRPDAEFSVAFDSIRIILP